VTVTIKSAAAAGAMLAHSGPATVGSARALGFAALVTWLLDAGSGAYMLGTWIARGGLRRQRATGDGLAPAVVFGHFGLASTGLLVWISYLATRLTFLAWLAVGVLMLVIGLGVSTVTLWTPFPARRADDPDAPADPRAGALTDDMLARALTDEVLLRQLVEDVVARVPADPSQPEPKPRRLVTTLIPAGHGIAAIATMLLAVLTATVGTR